MTTKPRARTSEEIEDDRQAFAQVNEVLAGRLHVPLEDGSSKVLYFMLHRLEGCDAIVSGDGFQVRFGWNPGPHPYFLNLAPACFSQLLLWAGTSPPNDEVRAQLPATQVSIGGFVPWSFSARQFWLRREEKRVVLAIRAGDGAPDSPWPDPILPGSRTPSRWW